MKTFEVSDFAVGRIVATVQANTERGAKQKVARTHNVAYGYLTAREIVQA